MKPPQDVVETYRESNPLLFGKNAEECIAELARLINWTRATDESKPVEKARNEAYHNSFTSQFAFDSRLRKWKIRADLEYVARHYWTDFNGH